MMLKIYLSQSHLCSKKSFCCITKLRSCSNVRFKEYKLKSEIYIKSPYVRGCNLWKQLPSNIQNAETLLQFKHLLTDELMVSLQM